MRPSIVMPLGGLADWSDMFTMGLDGYIRLSFSDYEIDLLPSQAQWLIRELQDELEKLRRMKGVRLQIERERQEGDLATVVE